MSKHDCCICNFVFHVSSRAAIVLIQVTGAPNNREMTNIQNDTDIHAVTHMTIFASQTLQKVWMGGL